MKPIRTNKISQLSWFKNMKNLLVLSLCICGLASAARADDLVVLKGSSVRVNVEGGIRKVVVADPAVIDAKPESDGLSVLVSGVGEGNSQLRIQMTSGSEIVTNVVVRSDLNQMEDQIKALLSDVEGLSIKVIGDKIVLQGDILTKSDYDKVGKVVAAYGTIILNLSNFDRSEMNKYVEQAILNDIGISTISAHVMGDTVILEGTVNSASESKRAEQLAALKMPSVKNLLQVQDVMVETDVQFVEVSGEKSKDMGYNVLDSLGVGLTGNAAGGTGSGGRIPVTFGVSASASAQIKALLGSGVGKIVSSPHISTKSGETGSFQSGGTTYFSVAGSLGSANLQSVDYGVILKVKPTLQGSNQILNEVNIEVSMPAASSSGVLTLQRYTTACTSLCKIGESMVLSGMTQKIANNTSSKTPLLGDIPLLNLFFSNRTSDRTRDEFVIVVTPRPVFSSVATDQPFSDTHSQILQGKDKD